MSDRREPKFLYLNRDGFWPDFQWQGLELRDDGSLRLESLPMFESVLEESATPPAASAPAGASVGPDGAIFFTDPDGHKVRRIDPCDRSVRPLPCTSGEGSWPTSFRQPRGVTIHSSRQALIIADADNHRLQFFDLSSFQLRDVWGGYGDEPGRLNQPWSVATDEAGNVYVADYGNRRVQKFDTWGSVVTSFWETASQSPLLQPVEVVVARGKSADEKVYVLDVQQRTIFVFETRGHLCSSIPLSGTAMPVGIMIHNDAIYVGANERRRLVKYALDGTIVGEAVGYEGPVAGLAADACGGLWLHPGDGSVPVRLSLDAAFVERGVLWGGPFGSPDRARDWHRLKALGIPVESGAHFRFFIYASDKSSAPPVPPDRASPQPFDPAWWREFPHNLTDVLADSTSRFLWIGALFESDGARSPQIEQVRLSFDHQTYSKHLPAIYSKEPDAPGRLAGPRQLDRFLSLFESFFTDVEETIGSLDRLFDPDAVPADWLDWLAGWLALELEEDLPIAMKRQALAEAFGAYAWRGTSRGLRAALRFYAGVEAHVEEPIVNAAWWSLPPDDAGDSPAYDTSVLGFSTRLVAAEPQGAVLGTTAVLDASQLITQEEFGGPLFEEVAHQFSVQLYRSQPVESRRIDEVRRIIDREKPAHTACHICLIEPRMRIGFQCILGVDTVVGGGTPSPSPLGEELNARAGAILAGNPAGRIGPQSRVGQTTWLGAAPRRPSDCSCDVDNTLDDKD